MARAAGWRSGFIGNGHADSLPRQFDSTVLMDGEFLHRACGTGFHGDDRASGTGGGFDAAVVGLHEELSWIRLVDGVEFVYSTGFASVCRKRGVELQTRPEARHIEAIELWFVERVDELDQSLAGKQRGRQQS